MELVFAYLAGLLTLVNPCVLPVLPIVLASSLQTDPRAPLVLAAGMALSFVAIGTTISAIGPAIGVYPEDVTLFAAVIMIGFGAVLAIPRLGQRFAAATGAIASHADARIAAGPRGIAAEFWGGALLGAVWSPCIGPTLGAAIALASTGQGIARAALIMAAFAVGVATLMILAAYGLRRWLRRNMARMVALSARARPVLGWVFICVGLALAFGLNHIVETLALRALPAWLVDFSVSI